MQGKNGRSRDICSGTVSSARQRLCTDESVYRQSGPYTRQDPGTAPLDTWIAQLFLLSDPSRNNLAILLLHWISAQHLPVSLQSSLTDGPGVGVTPSSPVRQSTAQLSNNFNLACNRTLHWVMVAPTAATQLRNSS